MDQGSDYPSEEGRRSAAAPTTGLSPALSTWEDYYKQASHRRRADGAQTLHDEKRRRRWRERFGIGLSALFVAALTTIFYLVLR
jgi:hypothetical protein